MFTFKATVLYISSYFLSMLYKNNYQDVVMPKILFISIIFDLFAGLVQSRIQLPKNIVK